MRQKIILEKNARSKIVLEQRTNPHHLMPDKANQVKYYFTPADMSDPNVAKLQRDETGRHISEGTSRRSRRNHESDGSD